MAGWLVGRCGATRVGTAPLEPPFPSLFLPPSLSRGLSTCVCDAPVFELLGSLRSTAFCRLFSPSLLPSCLSVFRTFLFVFPLLLLVDFLLVCFSLFVFFRCFTFAFFNLRARFALPSLPSLPPRACVGRYRA